MSELCKVLTSNPLLPSQVPLLQHQKQALTWLLWRESQRPCGGILGKQQNREVGFGGRFMAATVWHITYWEANNWLFGRHVEGASFSVPFDRL